MSLPGTTTSSECIRLLERFPPHRPLDLFGPAFLTPPKANPGVVRADNSEAHHQQQHNVSPVHHNTPPLHQTGTRAYAQRRGPGEGSGVHRKGTPLLLRGSCRWPPTHTAHGGFRRYGPAPTTPQTLTVFEPTLTMDPFRPNLVRAAARHYPQAAAAFAAHCRPLDPALAFQGFATTTTLQNTRSVAERMAGPDPAYAFSGHACSPASRDLSGSFWWIPWSDHRCGWIHQAGPGSGLRAWWESQECSVDGIDRYRRKGRATLGRQPSPVSSRGTTVRPQPMDLVRPSKCI